MHQQMDVHREKDYLDIVIKIVIFISFKLWFLY